MAGPTCPRAMNNTRPTPSVRWRRRLSRRWSSSAMCTLRSPIRHPAAAVVTGERKVQLGHVHFALSGHDRGGRVSYRLALDHPGRLSKLAVLDILPTYDYWEKMNRLYALNIYHWTFLAQPYPLPETLIGGNPDFFLR